MIRIILADDHDVVRHGVKAILEGEDDFRVVGETGDGLEVVALVEKLRPTVLIVDLMMPGMNGLEIIRQVKKRFPNTQIIVLSMHKDVAYVERAINNGANGYVLKDSTTSDLVNAIRVALNDETFISAKLADRVVGIKNGKLTNYSYDLYELLTDREREVLQLTAEGFSSVVIGERLSISHRTVETHRNNFMKKIKIKTREELVRFAIRYGIISLDN